MLITLKFVLFISNSIKLEPTNPAPPVTTIIFLTFGIYLYYIIGKTNKSKVVGIFTDGDLRRCLNEKIDINLTKIKDVMTKKFKTIDSMTLAIDAAEVMETNKIFTLVVMSGTKNVGVLSMHDLIQASIL